MVLLVSMPSIEVRHVYSTCLHVFWELTLVGNAIIFDPHDFPVFSSHDVNQIPRTEHLSTICRKKHAALLVAKGCCLNIKPLN